MFKTSLKAAVNNKRKLVVFGLVAALLVLVPTVTFSSKKAKVYVDASASGTQNGTNANPFKTIKQAMDAVSGKTEIHVAKGIYKENVKIKEDVEIFGADKNAVIIEAADRDEPVVSMEDDSLINKVTIKKGKYGILVDNDAGASVIKCVIKDNKKDGIKIEKDGTKKSRMVNVSESEIRNNGGAGIYSQKRRLSLVKNEVRDNAKDGIDIEKGAVAWIAENKIKDNEGVGLKLRVDGSEIWTKKNTISGNDNGGAEISFSGEAGRIDLAKSKIYKNSKFGIVKVQRGGLSNSMNLWNRYLTFNGNQLYENPAGNISKIFVVNK